MPDEKHNEAGDWKSRLDDPACLPGETLTDKDAAWETLHARLREKPARKIAGWYWAAAACLLLALCLPWIAAHKAPANPSFAAGTPPAKEKPATDTQSLQATKTQPAKTNIPTQQITIITSTRLRENKQPSLPHTIAPVEIPAMVQANPVLLRDSPLLALAPVEPKKKLRVIALNELEPPVSDGSNTAGNTNKHNYRLKFNSGYAYVNSTAGAEPVRPGIFKIKLSPQN